MESIKIRIVSYSHLILIFSKCINHIQYATLLNCLFYYLCTSKQAADLAVLATERFLNDLRRDIGDSNFDRLLAITPTVSQCHQASHDFSQGKRFRFFSPSISTYVKCDDRWLAKLRRFWRKFLRFLQSIWIGTYFQEEDIHQPTYDLSDEGVNVKDVNNFRAAPYVFGKENLRRKKRMIDRARKYRYQRTYF